MIPIIDTLAPLGDFFAVLAEDVGVNGVSLEAVLHASELELAKKASKEYVVEQIAAIPKVTKTSQLQNDSGFLTQHQDLSAYAKKSEIPTVPTKTSQLQNDSGFLTQHQSLSEYAKKSEIPTIPTNVSAFQNDSGYLTEHQDISGKADQVSLNATNANVSAISERVDRNTTKTSDLQSQIDSLVIEASGDSNPEVVQARTDSEGVAHVDLKDRIDSEVINLKNDANEIRALINVLGKVTKGGYYAPSDGKLVPQDSYYYTELIPMPSGNTKITVNGVIGIVYYDANNNFMPSPNLEFYRTPTELTVPSTVSYIRMATDKPYRRTTGIYICTLAEYEKNIHYNHDGVYDFTEGLKDNLNKFTAPMNCMSNLTAGGYLVPANGAVEHSEGFYYSDFIPMNTCDKNTGNISVNKIVTNKTLGIIYYDHNRNFIASPNLKFYNNPTELDIPITVGYIRISTNKPFDRECGVYKTTLEEYNRIVKYNYDGIYNKIAEVENKVSAGIVCGSDEQYTTLKSALEAAVKIKGAKVIVKKGVYNLIDEFGADYFANLTSASEKAGLQIYNDVHVYFEQGAKVVCNYTGSNVNVKKFFSPFNSGDDLNHGGFTLENLKLECSNVRYCVHDEHVNDNVPYTQRYINCDMKQDNSNNTAWNDKNCIGGGLGGYGDIVIENCTFESVGANVAIVTYHNTRYVEDAKSRIVIKDCYFKGNTTAKINSYGVTTEFTDVLVSNCSLGQELAEGIVSIGGQWHDNMQYYAWNNEVRS